MPPLIELVVAWVLFPCLLAAACLGVGLLLRRAGVWMGETAMMPVGFAALISVSQLCLVGAPGVGVTIALIAALICYVVVLTVRGDVSAPPRQAVIVALVAFAVCSAPIVLSGTSTFVGYTKLGDTAIQMLGADALGAGRGLGEEAASSADVALRTYFVDSGYPSGSLSLLGAASRIVGQDVAWTYQPFLAFSTSMIALALFGLFGPLQLPPLVRGGGSVIAAVPALLYGYYLQGAIKEVVVAALVAAVALSIGDLVHRLRSSWAVRDVVPFALCSGALIAVVGFAAGVWILPAALGLLAIAFRQVRQEPVRALRAAMLALGVIAACAAAALGRLGRYTEIAGTVTTTQSEIGNLVGPLRRTEAIGIWLSGDFRFQPSGFAWPLTRVLIVIACVAIAFGVIGIVRRRAWGGMFLAGVTAVGTVAISIAGSPWADAKAYAIAGPALLYLAVVGAGSLVAANGVRKLTGLVLAVAVALGVMMSNVLAYGEVALGPRDRFEELERISANLEGRVLLPDFDEFSKYFARDIDSDVLGDTWRPVLEGGAYSAVVARRGARSTRPASGYSMVRRGRWYDVWRRTPNAAQVVATVRPTEPNTAIDCLAVRDRLEAAPAGARVRWAPMPTAAAASPERVPTEWVSSASGPGSEPRGGGTAAGHLEVPQAGRYSVWVSASSIASLSVRVGDREFESLSQRLNEASGSELVGHVYLPAGPVRWSVTVEGQGPAPGTAARGRWLSGVGIRREGSDPATRELPPTSWRSLCSKSAAFADIVVGKPARQTDAR